MACTTISSFNATPLSAADFDSNFDINTALNKNDENHRKLIRHLYRRIGYGASLKDIEDADGKTIDQLVEDLVNGHLDDYVRDDNGNVIYDANGNPTISTGNAANIFDTGKFDWVNREITLKKYQYCDNGNGNLIIGDECDDGDSNTTGEVIKLDCACTIPTGNDATEKVINNAMPPTYQTQLINNYWTNESVIGGSKSVRAKLMLFWHGHFPVEEVNPNAGRPFALLRYFKVLFNNAFGNFKTFVEEIGRTPAMLAYLNGYVNTANPGNDGSRTADENYARELLELFTMGEEYHGQSNYGDSDINSLARALSGWTYRGADEPVEGEFQFKYGFHDWTSKTFLDDTISGGTEANPYSPHWEAVFGAGSQPPGQIDLSAYTFILGNGRVTGVPLPSSDYPIDTSTGYPPNTTPDNQRGYITAGDLEYQNIHNIIFAQRENEIAYFICRKLYEFYIYGDVQGLNNKLEDEGQMSSVIINGQTLTKLDEYIEALATTFKNNNWEIIPVIKQLFKSEHFYDAGVIGAQIKSPVECGTSVFRAANLKGGWGADTSTYDYRYKLQLLNPDFIGTNPGYSEPQDTNHPNYSIDGINPMTGEGIDTNAYIGDKLQAKHALSSIQRADTWDMMFRWRTMEQRLLSPPNVAGWPGHQAWLNAFTWIKRREMMSYLTMSEFVSTGAAEKFRQLAINLLKLKYPSTHANYYTDPEEVTLVMWEHLMSVEPGEGQLESAVAKYTDGWPIENYGLLSIYPDNPAAISNSYSLWNQWVNAGVEEMAIAALGKQVLKMIESFTEQPEYQLN